MVFYGELSKVIPEEVFDELLLVTNRFSINSPLRLAHFLGQCAHESNEFKSTEENLRYSARRLHEVFKKYFPTVESALVYANNPIKIANKVYANRMGNGDEKSGDGYKYRGRGYIQLTGKYNYEKFDTIVPENIVREPDLVRYKYPLLSAAYFWDSKKLNSIADLGDSDQVIAKITKSINGGLIGQDKRILLFKKYYPLLKNTEK